MDRRSGSSLESRTKLDAPDRRGGYWELGLYREAAEGRGAYHSGRATARGGIARVREPDPDEAGRRARGQVRRYCAANRLNRLGTLTYEGAGCHDPAQLRADVAAFFRRLRRRHEAPFPYLWVPEWHPGGHGLHVHFAVGRFIPRGWIEADWDRGFVHIKLLGDLPVGGGALREARETARYLAKYVNKDVGAGRDRALHRYEVAQGFQPRRVAITGWSADEVVARASHVMGRAPATLWRSSDVPGWERPPAVWVSWDA